MTQITYRKIPFYEIKKLICDWLQLENDAFLNLIPVELHKLISDRGFPVVWTPIPEWDSFAYGYSDFEIQHLLALFPVKLHTAQQILIITDPGFRLQLAYALSSKDFTAFAESIYPVLHQEDFIQPSDLILLFPETSCLFMLHHEGWWTSVDFSDSPMD